MPELIDIETSCFTGDRISRTSFRRLLAGKSAATLVDGARGGLRGYALLLFRRSSSVARLYSFAVTPAHRRRGVGRRLLAAAIVTARARRARALRLEIRPDNPSARLLYERAGFVAIGRAPRFYEDGADAVRMEMSLISRKGPKAP
jgi:ribosomal protein S18 acetylase RimI-like enzyme